MSVNYGCIKLSEFALRVCSLLWDDDRRRGTGFLQCEESRETFKPSFGTSGITSGIIDRESIVAYGLKYIRYRGLDETIRVMRSKDKQLLFMIVKSITTGKPTVTYASELAYETFK